MEGNAQRLALVAGGWAWTMFESRKNSQPEKGLEIRTLPTSPLHAMLDELLVYRDYVLIIVLKHNEVMGSEVKKRLGSFFFSEAERKGEVIKRCEIIEQTQSAHPK